MKDCSAKPRFGLLHNGKLLPMLYCTREDASDMRFSVLRSKPGIDRDSIEVVALVDPSKLVELIAMLAVAKNETELWAMNLATEEDEGIVASRLHLISQLEKYFTDA